TDTTAPFSFNWNTTTGADGAATIKVEVEDMAGNTTTSPLRNVSVDNVAPTPTLADPGQYLNGTVSLSATSDPDTTQVDFERRPGGGGSWVTIASDTTLPWDTSLDTTALADGLYDFRAVATDQTGHTGTSPIRPNVDVTAPTVVLANPGATISGTVTLAATVSGTGATQVVFGATPAGGGAWTPLGTDTTSPWSVSYDTTKLTDGMYDLRATVSDGL